MKCVVEYFNLQSSHRASMLPQPACGAPVLILKCHHLCHAAVMNTAQTIKVSPAANDKLDMEPDRPLPPAKEKQVDAPAAGDLARLRCCSW